MTVFELVTPRQGRRLYQATSEAEMKQWLYAICNAIESCINGTSSVRTFDTSKLRTPSGALDDHALPTRKLFPSAQRGIGLGLPRPSLDKPSASNRRSLPPPSSKPPSRTPSQHDSSRSSEEKRQRKTSFKKVLRQSAEIAGEKWNSVMANRSSSQLDLSRPAFTSRPSNSAKSSTEGHLSVPPLTADSSPVSQGRSSELASWYDDSDDIERSVLAMVGLELDTSSRRVMSEGHALARLEGKHQKEDPHRADMTRTRSADAELSLDNCSEELLRIADLPENRLCADCGKRMKSSRWATLSEYRVIEVMLRC